MPVAFCVIVTHHKYTYLQWAGILVSVVAFGYLIYRLATYTHYADIGLLFRQAGAWEGTALLAAVLLIPVQLWAEAVRWKWLLRGWKDISLKDSWHQVLIGMVAGFITPYRAGDIPARLVSAGLDIDREQLKIQGRAWLHDWHKWFPVIAWTVVRYLLWGLQLWAVLRFVGIFLTPWQAVSSIAIYYVCVSIMPSLPVADVAMKGGWAVLIFGQYTANVPAIAIAVSIIWIFNTIIPVLFASLEKFLYFCKQKNK